MDQKLLRRVQAVGAVLVAVAYFLPWASIISPFGSIQIRGLYVDYAWIVLLLAVIHLLAQFAEPNREALLIPDQWMGGLRLIRSIFPFLIVGFLAWYGSQFSTQAHLTSGTKNVNLFGASVESVVRAGLDYGYWIGISGSVLLVLSVGLAAKRIGPFGAIAVSIAAVSLILAYGVSRHGKGLQANSHSETPGTRSTPRTDESEAKSSPEPEFDTSPYIQVISITGRRYGKDYGSNRYSNSVVITPVFKNVSSKTIVGLRGRLSVLDGFNNEVYSFNFRADDKLPPGGDTANRGGYEFEDNQFINDEPYDKIAPVIVGETAKYSVRLTQIAFSDGTILPEKK